MSLSAKTRAPRSAHALRVGSLRSAIVLYDEPHPSLKVHRLKKLAKEFAKSVHPHRTPSSPSTSSARTKTKANTPDACSI
ncbi:hypothetical protein BT96DRAFT_1008761 [Gymnopus androsaceus JB14]|uniref:Uncharacterized protein n=1 Tax=Gymnopus androsaceus JB14 TaxID=1447944 RepID=A0A6A4GEK6_9AGAR|nr:hypothetical protein BT96DRAFT_1008761 [Gymnopus androsaceus JB14]